LSDFNGAAARDLVMDDADVQLGRAMNAAFFEGKRGAAACSIPRPRPDHPSSVGSRVAGPGARDGLANRDKSLRDDALMKDPTLALRPGVCRWPIGEPGEAGFHYCGAASVSGRSYCRAHLDIAIDRVLSPIHSEAGIPGFRLQNRHKGRAA
jgi:hypothetical protein